MLLLASQLRPDPQGWGTHEQLGLPRCTLLAVADIRCPACGMTTSWAYATQGQLAMALRTHVSGTLLALAAAIVAVASWWAAARGAWPLGQLGETGIVVIVAVAAALVLGEWIVRLCLL